MTTAGNALLLAGTAVFVGSAVFFQAVRVSNGVQVTPRTTRRLAVKIRVTRVLLGPGYGIPTLTAAVDIVVGGEISEAGGNAEYALDAAGAGQPRGMIVLGHMMSEDHGMQEVADWLRTFLTDMPVAFVPAGEPFSA